MQNKHLKLLTWCAPIVILLTFFAVLFARPVAAAAGINQQLSFQGKIVNSSGGTNISNATYNMEFKIYCGGDGVKGSTSGDCTNGTTEHLLWTEDRLVGGAGGITLTDGTFQINLGAVTAFGGNVNWNEDKLWLSLQIGNSSSCTISTNFQTDCSGDGEMDPYIRLTAVPYALNANMLGGLVAGNYVQLAQGLQTDSSTSNASIAINKTNSSGTPNILQLQKSSSDVLVVDNAGYILQTPASLTSGKTALAQTFTNASSSGGTVNGISQTVTVSNTSSASTTNGINIAITDATTLANISNGVNSAITDNGASGAKTNKAVVGTAGGSNTSAVNYGGYFSLSGGAATSSALYASNGTTNGNILQLQDNTTSVVTIADGGSATFANSINSVSAFQIQNSNNTGILGVSTISNTQNLLANPSFESNTTGWAALNGSTLSTVSSPVQSGSQSLQAVLNASNASDGVKYTYNFKPNTVYTLSVYAAITSGSTSTFEMGTVQNGGAQTNCGVTGVTLTGSLTRYTCTGFTTGSTTTGNDYFYFKRTTAAAGTLVFDAAQLEQAGAATTFADQPYTNLLSNSSIEGNSNGWSLHNGGTGNTVSSNTDFAQFGTGSLKVVTGTVASNGAQYNTALQASSRYTMSFWARVDTGSASFTAGYNPNPPSAGSATNDSACTTTPDITAGSAVTTTWTQFTCTFTVGATINGLSNVFIKQTDTSSDNLYIDGLTLTPGGTAQVFYQPAASLQADPLYGKLALNSSNVGEIQAWQLSANSLPAVRASASSVLANGYVYLIGGDISGGSPSTTVYYAKLNADGSIGAWNTNSNVLPAARQNHTSVAANGYVYVIGGSGSSTTYYAKLNTDGTTGVWQISGYNLPTLREKHTSVVANGYVYVIGGGTGGSGYQATVYYAKLNADGTMGPWNTNANNLGTGHGNASSYVANGYIYVTGGDTGVGTYYQTTLYARLNPDGSTGAWSTVGTALPYYRSQHSTVVANGYVYVMGGYDNNGIVNQTVYYAKLNTDGTIGSWASSANVLPEARAGVSSFITNGYVYLLGGYNGSAYQSSIYYASTSRISVGGSLDLIGNSGQSLSDAGGYGGSLTAGNTNIIGTLDVRDQTNFTSSVAIGGNLNVAGSFALQSASNSSSAFQVQNSNGISTANFSTISGNQNLLANPNFESNTQGWSGYGSGGVDTLTTTSTAAAVQNGTQGLSDVTTASAGRGIKYIYPLKARTTYTFSVYAAVSSGSTGAFFDLGRYENNVATTTSCPTAQTLTTTLTRFTCTFTTGATINLATDGPFARYTDATNVYTLYFDAAQLERSAAATTFVDQPYANAVSNSSLEAGTNGWSLHNAGAGNVISTSNEYAQFGSASLKLVTGTAADNGAQYNIQLQPNTRYTLSFWARKDTGSATFSVGHNPNPASAGSATNDANCTMVPSNTITATWAAYSCTFTVGATVTGLSNIFIKQADTTSDNLYIDGLTLTPGGSVQTFVQPAVSLQADPLYGNLALNNSNIGEIQPWQLSANALPTLRSTATAVVANGYAYLIGGDGGSGATSTVYYSKLNADGSMGAWSTNSYALPDPRYGHSSVVANGYVYVIGGHNSSAYQQTVYYAKLNADGSTGAWQTNANTVPALRRYHSSVAANGYVYVIGGSSGSDQQTVYYAKLNADGSTGVWNTNINILPAARSAHTTVVANGYVYVIGGSGAQTSVYYARLNTDGSIGAWSTNANILPAGRGWLSSAVANGYVYVIGGQDGSGIPSSTIYYAKLNADGSTGSWNVSTNALPGIRTYQSSVTANGYTYVIGGYNNAAHQSTIYYSSNSRILVGGSLDLVGLSGQTDGDVGGNGGSLTAGNTSVLGLLDVRDQANFSSSVGIGGSLTVAGGATIKGAAGSTAIAQIQNAGGLNALNISTVNLIGNSSFETGTNATTPDGWAIKGASVTITTDNTAAEFGSNSMKVVTGGSANAGAVYNFNFAAGTQYTLSFWAKSSAGTYNITAGHQETGADVDCSASSFTTTWTRFTCTSFTPASTSGTPNIYFKDTGTSHTFFIDGVQLEAAAAATGYRSSDIALDGIVTLQPAILIAGQSQVTQTLTNASSAAGTINGYNQTITVASTASTTNNGFQITMTDNSSGQINTNTGLKITLNGSNSNQSVAGVDVTVNQGSAIRGASSGNQGPMCGSFGATGISAGVCGTSSYSPGSGYGYGVIGSASGAAAGRGVVGEVTATGQASGDYIGLWGQSLQTAAAAYTSIGVTGSVSGGAGATVYGGSFSASGNATTGSALKASNSTSALNIIQLQDSSTDVLVVSDGGALTVTPNGNNIGTIIKQTSGTATSGNVFDVQGANGTSHFITVAETAANAGSVSISSLGSNDLTLDSGSAILKMGSNTTSIQKVGSAFALDLSNGSSNSTLTVSNTGGAGNITLALDSGGVFAVGGSTGSTISACGSNNYVASFAATGGIVTGGSCATIASTNLSDTANIARLDAANTFAPTTNNVGTTIKQTSGTATSGSLFDVQGANGTTHFIQITNAAANEGNVTVQSIGATRDLTLDSGSGTIKVGSTATALQKAASAFAIDLSNGGSDSTLTVSNTGGAGNIILALDSGGAFKVGSSTGSNITACSAGEYLATQAVVGGITTAGTCTTLPVPSATKLAASYAAGASQSDSTLLLDSTRLGVILQDNASPISGSLFTVQSNTGAAKYLDVTSTGLYTDNTITIENATLDVTTLDSDLSIRPGSTGIAANSLYLSGSNTGSGSGGGVHILGGNGTPSGGSVYIDAGTGSGSDGSIFIGNSTANTISIGNNTGFINLVGNRTTISPVGNNVGTTIVQTSGTATSGNVFDVQGANGTSHFITVAETAANQGSISITSLGSNDLTLDSGSATLKLGSTTTTLQKAASAFAIDLSNGGSDSTLTVSNTGGAGNIILALDSGGAFKVGSSTGSTISACSSNNYVSSFAATGGIVTGGSCATIASTNLSDTANIARLDAANTFAPTANNSGMIVRQTSGTATSGNILDIQGANGTSHFLQVTETAANQGSISITSLGSNDLTLDSGSGTLKLGSTTTALQKSASAFALDLSNGGSDSTLTVSNTGGAGNIILALDSGGAFKVGSSTGSTVSACGAGQYLSSQAVTGGIVTGGSCSNVSGQTSLQNAYDNSSSPATITTSSASKGILLQAGSGSDSVSLFQIQNATGVSIADVSTISNTQNLLANPSFESNSSGWAALNGATLSLVSSPIQSGTQSLQAVLNASNASDGVKYVYNFKPNTVYTLSVYAAITSGSTATFEMGTVQNGGAQTNCGVTGVTLTGSLTRYTCTAFTTGTTTTGIDYFYLKRTTAAAGTLVFDAAQLEQAGAATTFADQTYPNLVNNSSLESSSNGWSLHNGGTGNVISNSNDFARYGTGSLKVVTGTVASNGAQYNTPLQANTRYSMSFWARVDTGSASFTAGYNPNPATLSDPTNDSACTTTPDITAGSAVTTTWTQFTCTFTVGATINGLSNVFIKQTDTSTDNLYIDGLTLTAGASAQTFTQPAASLQADPLYGNMAVNNSSTGEIQPWQTSANSLPDARANASTISANGYAYVIGGQNASNVAQTTVYYAKLNADGSTGAWQTSTNSLPAARYQASAVSANGYVYLIGGNNGVPTIQSTVYYAKLNSDGSTGVWQTNGNALPAARRAHSSVVANGYVYVIGGNSTTFGAFSQSSVFYAKLNADGSAGRWQTNSIVYPSNVQDATVVSANGYVYVLGGRDDAGIFPGSFFGNVRYARLNTDGSTGSWSSAVSVPYARIQHTSAIANGYIYVVGGTSPNTDGGVSKNTVAYSKLNGDGSLASWNTSVNTLPTPLSTSSSVMANGYIYELGGYNGSAIQSTVLYTSTSRVLLGGSLDLVGLGGQNLSDAGSSGGSLTAGDITAVGALQVQGQGGFAQGVSIDKDLRVGGSVTFRNTTDSLTNLSVQNAGGVSLLNISTVNIVKNSNFEYGTLSVNDGVEGWTRKGAAGITIQLDNTAAQFGSNSMKFVTTALAQDGVKYPMMLVPSTQYTLSFYGKLSSGSIATLAAGYSTDGSTDTTPCTLNSNTINTTFTRFSCTFTTASSFTGTPTYIYISQGTTNTVQTFFIDGVQLETAGSATGYRNGDITIGGIVSMQSAAALIAGQSAFSQTVTNGDASGGTVNADLKTITISNTGSASTTNGINIGITDATALTNSTNGLNSSITDNGASGAKTNKAVVGTAGGSNTSAVNYGGYFSLSGGAATSSAIYGSNGSTSGNILQLQDNTTTVAVVADNGAATFQNSTNSANAFQIQNSGGTQLLNIDTTNPITDLTNNATKNLITNGSLETNATGWAKMGTTQVAVARDTSRQYIGTSSLKIVTNATDGAGTDGAAFALTTSTLKSNTQYSLSVYVRLEPGQTMSTLQIGHSRDGTAVNETSCLTAQTVNGNGWTQFNCNFTTLTTSSTPYIYIKQTDAVARTIYIDGIYMTRFSLLANASVEQAISGSDWQLKGSATVTRDTGQFQDGVASLKVVTSAGASNNDGAKNNITLNDSTIYSVSFYGKLDSGSTALTTMEVGYSSDGTADDTVCITGQTLVSSGWTSFTCTLQTPASHSNTPFLYVKELNTTGPKTFYVDAFQINSGNPISTYREGLISLNGVINSNVTIQPGTNSTTAFQVQNATGNKVMALDTTNNHLKIYGQNSSNYADIYYDAATSTAYYGASSGTAVLGSGTGATSVASGSGTGVTITGDTASTFTTTTGSITIQAATSLSLLSTGANAISVDSSTTGAVSLGSNANAKAVTIGNNQSATTIDIDAGTGATAIEIGNTASAHGIQIGTGAAVQTVVLGSTDTTSATTIQGGSGNIILNDGNGNEVVIGSATADANAVVLQVDSYNGTFTPNTTPGSGPEASGVCSTSADQGGIYYSTVTNAMRACLNGSWEDLVSTAGLGIISFGVIADSGSNPGDLPSLQTTGATGPCRVHWQSTTSVRVEPCIAYSGGRKVIVAQTDLTLTTTTTNLFQNVCLTGTSGAPALLAAAATQITATVPTFSINNPIECLATIKQGSGAGASNGHFDGGATAGNIYDVRTFTQTVKEFTTSAAAVGLGYLVIVSGTGVTISPATANTVGQHGIVVATNITAVSGNTPHVIIATHGPGYAVATAGTAGQYVASSGTLGFATSVTAAGALGLYGYVGPTRTTWAGTCTSAATCLGSLYVDINLR